MGGPNKKTTKTKSRSVTRPQPKSASHTVGHICPHIEDLIPRTQIQRAAGDDRSYVVDVAKGSDLLPVAEDGPGTSHTARGCGDSFRFNGGYTMLNPENCFGLRRDPIFC